MYAERYYTLISAIRAELVPLGAVLLPSPVVVGGYFIWVKLPSPLSASDLAPFALQNHGVKIAPGGLFQVQGDLSFDNSTIDSCIRLCFAWEELENLAQGVSRLAEAMRALIEVA